MAIRTGAKAFFYFTGPIGKGWTENIGLNPAIADIPTAITKALAVATARLPWLSTDCALTYVVVRGAGSPRLAQFANWTASFGTGPTTCNVVEDTISMTWLAGGITKRQYEAHGIPDTWVTAGDWATGGKAAWTAAAAAWFAAITDGSWIVQTLTSIRIPQPMLSAITPAVGSDAVITTVGPHGLLGINPVIIRGYRGDPNRLINGTWKFSATGANTGTLVGSHRYQFNASGGGKMYPIEKSGTVISDLGQFFIATRKVGPPFDRTRGRRSPILLHA